MAVKIRKKWRLASHTLRKKVDNTTRQALECKPQGKRRKKRMAKSDMDAERH